jgi:hypothetical protein
MVRRIALRGPALGGGGAGVLAAALNRVPRLEVLDLRHQVSAELG